MNETHRSLQWEQLGERAEPAGFLKVRCRQYRYPNGKEDVWDILVGGRTVAIMALTDDDHVVLVRQFRPGPGKELLELPGGMVGLDERVEKAALRELLEETGYQADSAEVVMQTYLAAYATHVRHAVVARGCRRVAEPNPDGAEFVEPVTLPIGEFVQHVITGQLTDVDMALAGLVATGFLKPTA